MDQRWLAIVVALVCASGCASKKSSLLLERPARGPLNDVPTVAQRVAWQLEPAVKSLTQNDIEIIVTHAPESYLKTFFSNKAVFGPHAGVNPYYPVHLVFYAKVINRSLKKIFINPANFVLVDDRGNQYDTLGQDYITAFAESRQPMATMTRDLLEDARPGYFGVSVPVGKFFAQKPIGRFALLLQSALKPGPLFAGSTYDGLIAFWSPSSSAKTLRLILTGIKADFDASDFPKNSLDFVYEYRVVNQ
jgi:hypothetical protein